MRLNEFVAPDLPPSGSDGGAGGKKDRFIQCIMQYARSPAVDTDDRQSILEVAEAFRKSVKLGIKKFFELDTVVREDLTEYLLENGFNVEQIFKLAGRTGAPKAPAGKSSPVKPLSKIQFKGSLEEFKNEVSRIFPGAVFEKYPNVIQANFKNIAVGTFNPSNNTGTIVSENRWKD